MGEMLKILRERFFLPFQNLMLAQRITMLMVFSIAILGTVAIVKWAVQPDYVILVSDVDPADTQPIIDELEAQNVPYKITQNGRAIMVPSKQLYQSRINLASKNLPATSGLGYEIFDKTDIGVSEFVQQLNYRRALEGELSRTIQSMAEIDKARVHIVFPKERVFKEDQEQASASIFLSLKGRAQLREEQINGIAQLVAGSIEGLDINQVTIVDSHGKVLTRNRKTDSLAAMNETQLELQLQLERYLEEKAQIILDRFLGPGNSVVKTTADLDFRRIEKTNEIYDPDNAAVLSEETSTQTGMDSSNYGEMNSEHTITNYQITKTMEHIFEDTGSIKRLTVAILVNDRQVKNTDTDGNTVIEYNPRTADELLRIETLAKNAIGFNTERGDELVVQNLAFEGESWVTMDSLPQENNFWEQWGSIIQKVVIGLLILIGYFMIRSKFNKAKKSLFNETMPQLDGVAPTGGHITNGKASVVAEPEVDFLEEIEKATAGPMQRNEDISSYIQNNPSMTAQLIRAWLTEG